MGGMVLYRQLTRKEKICFDCPLPECDEESVECPWRQVRKTGNPQARWEWLRERIAEMPARTGPLMVHFKSRREVDCAQSAVQKRAWGRVPCIAVRTQRSRDYDYTLMIWRVR